MRKFLLLLIFSFLIFQGASAQTRALKGKVTDDRTGDAIPGVNIRLTNDTKTVTDQNGNYTISVPTTNPGSITISYIGYTSQTVTVGSKVQIDIKLVSVLQDLDEVVIIGYGAVKKPDLTGSVAQVNISDMQKAPVKSFDDALAGRVAGVEVSSNEGQPGISNNIVIRGNNSVTQDNTPLYVIDGFPIDNPNNNVINPDEIESITVLKDASSTAIYGSRGANGVILITTKRGQIGEPVVKYNGYAEAPKDRWKACARCQQRIKAEGLKDEHELQSYFIKRVENFLLTKNKRIIGWDEILEGGLAPNAAVMSWRGVDGGIAAAKLKHEVVMSPSTYLYFDYYQGEPHLEPAAIGGFLPLRKVYNYEPADPKLTAEEATYIKGVQGNVWSEYIHNPQKVEYMAFPRAAALAEIAWTQPKLKNWENFAKKMEDEYKRYDKIGINYSTSAYNVFPIVKIDPTGKKAEITLQTDSYNPQIRYTINGTEPTLQSTKYEKPFEVSLPVTIKAGNFKNGKQLGKTSARSIIEP